MAWLLIQAASILFPTFQAPAWVMKVFVTLVAAGFPFALILAWAFELTPEGIKLTKQVAPMLRGRNARVAASCGCDHPGFRKLAASQ